LSDLEENSTNMNDKVDEIKSDLSDLEENSTSMNDKVDEIKSNLSNLEENTTNLNDKVDEINGSIDNLEREAIKQKGFDLYRLFIAKVETLDGDIFDNVKMTVEDFNWGRYNFVNYKMQNGKMICYLEGEDYELEQGNPDRYEVDLYYEMEYGNTLYSDFVNKEIKAGYFYKTHNPLGSFNDFIDTEYFKTVGCVVDCVKLENDNYRLIMFDDLSDKSLVSIIEITNDGYIVSAMFNAASDGLFSVSLTYNFEYGVVTEEEMQEKLDIVNALPDKVSD
jgi:regulator of replication initiation timing